MILKKPAPDLIRGGNGFSDKIMVKRKGRLRQGVVDADAAGLPERHVGGVDRMI